jgi:hypothetical protein
MSSCRAAIQKSAPWPSARYKQIRQEQRTVMLHRWQCCSSVLTATARDLWWTKKGSLSTSVSPAKDSTDSQPSLESSSTSVSRLTATQHLQLHAFRTGTQYAWSAILNCLSTTACSSGAVGTSTGCGLENWVAGALVPVGPGSGAHPASYPLGTGGSFPGVKAAGASRSRERGYIHPLSHTPS